MKLNDSTCPRCGVTILRNHSCPARALTAEERAVEEALEAEARARCWDVLRAAQARREGRVAAQELLVEVTP